MEKDMMGRYATAEKSAVAWSAAMEGGGSNGGGCGCGAETSATVANATACRGYEGCGEDSWGLSEYPLAMVYAPCQSFRALYDPATALSRGTLFTELDLPLGKTCAGLCTEGCADRCRRS